MAVVGVELQVQTLMLPLPNWEPRAFTGRSEPHFLQSK